MKVDELGCYIKIGEIAQQIQGIHRALERRKKIDTVGYPKSYSPQSLIEFQWKRIHTLETVIRMKDTPTHIMVHLDNGYAALCDKCQDLFDGESLHVMPCSTDFESYAQLKLISEYIND